MKDFIPSMVILVLIYLISNLIPIFFIYGKKNVNAKEMDDDYEAFRIVRYIITGIVLLILIANLLYS